VTEVVQGVLTTIEYTTSTSTVTVTGSTNTRIAKTVTAGGNAQIDTAQSKFGGASGLFGASSYLSIPDSADWYFGSGDFTIDLWYRPSSGLRSGVHTLFSQRVDDSNYMSLFADWSVAPPYVSFRVVSGGRMLVNVAGYSTIAVGSWYHLAVVRNGNVWTTYQNGMSLATTTAAASIPDLAAPFLVGWFGAYSNFQLYGWLDEFHVSQSVARWTSNFTPPTSPYVGDANTVLLLHMDGADASTAFIDSC
jgi:hypothetical protein